MSDLFTDPGAGGAPPPIAEAPPVIAPPPALSSAVPAEPLVPWVSIWTRPRATLRQVLGAVLWSFFGVRKGDAMRRDAVTIKPHQVIIVGILLAAVLVVALLIVVRLITRNV